MNLFVLCILGFGAFYFYASNKTNLDSSQQVAQTIPISGLVAHWKFDGNANDSIGSNNGTLTNGPTFTTGKAGQAISLDGVDDRINLPPSIARSNTNQFTISGWFNNPSLNSIGEAIFAEGRTVGGDTTYFEIIFYNDGNNKISVGARQDNSAGPGNLGLHYSSPNLVNTWHHFVFVRNAANSFDLFIDGTHVGSSVQTLGTMTIDTVNIGARQRSGIDRFYSGLIDEVRIYNRALTAQEVSDLYTAENSGSTSSPPPAPPPATPPPSPTPTPPQPQPTPAPQPTPTPSSPVSLNIGSRVFVEKSGTLNVYSTAGGSILGTQPYYMRGTVVGGPSSIGGFSWWNIDWDINTDGWVIESDIAILSYPKFAKVGPYYTVDLSTLTGSTNLNIHPNSSNYVGNLPGSIGTSGQDWGRPIWFARSNTPTLTTILRNQHYTRDVLAIGSNIIPIPSEARQPGWSIQNSSPCNGSAGGSCYFDNLTSFISADRNIMWDCYQSFRISDTSWSCGGIKKWYTSNPVVDMANSPATTPGTTHVGPGPILQESILYEELKSGVINHPITFASGIMLGDHWGTYPQEAYLAGSFANRNLRYGMTFTLPSSYNCQALSDFASRVICEAIKKYGLIPIDQNDGSFNLNTESLEGQPLKGVFGGMIAGITDSLSTIKNSLLLVETLPSPVLNASGSISAGMNSAKLFVGGTSVSVGELGNNIGDAVSGFQTRYTTDGSEPTIFSSLYSGPITLNSSATIKVKRFKTGSIPSGIAKLNLLASGDRVICLVECPVYPAMPADSSQYIGGGKQTSLSMGTVVSGPNQNSVGSNWWRIDWDSGLDGWVDNAWIQKTGGITFTPPTPPPSATLIPGDINNDRIVNSLDWGLMNSNWLTNNSASDLNKDGIVNSIDFGILNGNWLRTS